MTRSASDPSCGFVVGMDTDGRVLCGVRPAPYEDVEDGTPLCEEHALAQRDKGRRVELREGAT